MIIGATAHRDVWPKLLESFETYALPKHRKDRFGFRAYARNVMAALVLTKAKPTKRMIFSYIFFTITCIKSVFKQNFSVFTRNIKHI